jgi:hypothetical protein
MICKDKLVFAVQLLRVLTPVIGNCARPLLVLPKVFIVFTSGLSLKTCIKHFDCFAHVDLPIIISIAIFCFSSFESLIVKFDVKIAYRFFIHQLKYHAILKITVEKKHLGSIQMLKLME